MLMLRLARAGSKKRPVYHLVAADRRARRDGRFKENLGYYIPSREILVLKQDRIDHWLSMGARATETASGLIKRARKAAGQAVEAAEAAPEPAKAEPEKAEPEKAEPAQAEPEKAEPAQADASAPAADA